MSWSPRGWVDFVQWTGPSPAQDPENWQQIAYKDDVLGQRSEKKVDGYSTRYAYDGGHIIAEYDGNNNLLRKYIYGPGIDQPVSMIEVAQSNATYYYHFDALGSVVALSNANGDTVQTYEYSVYGEVAVEDANHTNPYMFAGVRYDIEIGLYYNRARYYNPFTGRFLQTDPIGYGGGMNLYAYCGNSPLNFVDPFGLTRYGLTICPESFGDSDTSLKIAWEEIPDDVCDPCGYDFIVDCNGEEELYAVINGLTALGELPTGRDLLRNLAGTGLTIAVRPGLKSKIPGREDERIMGRYEPGSKMVEWDPTHFTEYQRAHMTLGHEFIHAHHDIVDKITYRFPPGTDSWETAHEEARTNGVRVIYGPTGEVLADFTGERFTMRKLYGEAGLTFPFPDQVWDPYR